MTLHARNQLRLLAGIQIDPVLESKENRTITEAREVPRGRSNLTGKDQKSLNVKVAKVNAAIKHLEQTIKSLEAIPATDFNGDIPHYITELEYVLDGDGDANGLRNLAQIFDKDHKTKIRSDKAEAKTQAEEEEDMVFNQSMELDESEQLDESWWQVKVKHRDTDGFKIQANTREEAESEAKQRLSQMRGGKGLIISIKQDTSTASSNDNRLASKVAKMETKDRDALYKKADQKSRAGGSLTPIEQYVLDSSSYKTASKATSSTATKEKDHDGDGKVESSKEEHKGVVDKAINKEPVTEMKASYGVEDHVRTSMGSGIIIKKLPSTEADDFYSVKLDENDELAKKLRVAGETHRFGSFDFKGHVKESMHYYVDNKYTNYEDDDDKPVNVTDGSANDEQVWDKRTDDRDESPCQLNPTGDLNDSKPGNTTGDDSTEKMNIPAGIKQSLKAEIDQARAKAKKLDSRDKEASYFYNDLANAFEDLSNKLESGTVYDFKQAQTFAQTLMGPMLHKIPSDVWKFLANGGKTRSLKSYMQEVKYDGQQK